MTSKGQLQGVEKEGGGGGEFLAPLESIIRFLLLDRGWQTDQEGNSCAKTSQARTKGGGCAAFCRTLQLCQYQLEYFICMIENNL